MALKDLFLTPTRPQLDAEYGVTGTSAYRGIITDEYKPQLIGDQAIKTYDNMRRGDAQVYAALQAIKLPIRSADWFIEDAKGEDPTIAKEQAEFIEEQLFENLNWDRQLQRILTFLDFGFKYLEIVYTIDADGLVGWKKWGDRLQKAHYAWLTQDGAPGVQQRTYNADKDLETGEDLTKKGSMISIPADKLLIFTYQQEGDNMNGISALRPAYKHWYFKENMYKIAAISAERYGVGIPRVKVPGNFNTKDMSKAQEMGKNLKSNEKGYIAQPNTWEVDILTPTGDPKAAAIQDLINHHDHKILMSVLAPFLDLGGNNKKGGSYALSKDQSSFFTMCLQAIAKDVAAVVNKKIRELVLVNWPGTKDFPTLRFAKIGELDYDEYSKALAALAGANMVDLTPEVQEYIHKAFNLPAPPEQTEEDHALNELEGELAIIEGETAGDGTPPPTPPTGTDPNNPNNPQDPNAPKPAPGEAEDGEEKDPNAPAQAEADDRTEMADKAVMKTPAPTDKTNDPNAPETNQPPVDPAKAAEQTAVDEGTRKIAALRKVIANFKEQSKKTASAAAKKQFNASIKAKINEIKATIATGRQKPKEATAEAPDANAAGTIDTETKAREKLAKRRDRLQERKDRANQGTASAKTPQARARADAQAKEVQDAIDKIDNTLRSSHPVSMSDFDTQDTTQPTAAERIFQRAANEQENYLQSRYDEWDALAGQTEQAIADYVQAMLAKATTEQTGGVTSIARTGNSALLTEIKQGVAKRMKRMSERMLGNAMAGTLMKESAQRAAQAWADMKTARTNLSRIEIDEGQLRSFTAGHISNMNGVFFNELRQINEKLNDNFTQGVSVRLATEQAKQIAFNRNTLKLSVTTHPRALFKAFIEGQAKAEGTIMFKMLVPTKTRSTLAPAGMTAALLYLIRTFHDWNKENGTKNNVNVTGGMGIHHNSQEYYYPVDQEELPTENAIAKDQRTVWLEDLKERAAALPRTGANAAAAAAAVAAVAALLKTQDEKTAQ